MSLDKIVVIIMALAFFGGLAFVYWKGRREEPKGTRESSPASPTGAEEVPPDKSQGKGRRAVKS